ncbi:MAG: hypothetical protein IPJ61_19005 [Tessaracoccus sp.]|uniref:hypothetical protein n=1 Tax=Tessaracoccus sp. TaxID=1971211 RepID=UPI001EBBB50D|nr:hypothetical protein [Tessaracoccus sp.]MBK7823076.1 hypothetical protein [Tessaracoccus sp.]
MPSVEDVTERVLASVNGPGPYVARVRKAAPMTKLTPAGAAQLAAWNGRHDKTLPFVSNVLAYGFENYVKPGWHSGMVRLVKGGHLRFCRVDQPAPAGSFAQRTSPYGTAYYLLRPACPAEVADGTIAGQRRRRRR